MTGSFHLFTVAIDNYVEIRPILKTAVADAIAIAELLVARYGFSAENTTQLHDIYAKRNAIIDDLHRVAYSLTPEDSLLIYLAGHGDTDETGEGYFQPEDAKKNSPATRVYYSDVLRIIRASHARHILLIIDACFPSAVFQSRAPVPEIPLDQAASAFRITSREAITSGGYHEVSDSDELVKEHSPFAHHLSRVLRESNSHTYCRGQSRN